MPHISKEFPLVGHGEKGGKTGSAVNRKFVPRNSSTVYVNFGDDDDDDGYDAGGTSLSRYAKKSNICVEGGDCADRVNEE